MSAIDAAVFIYKLEPVLQQAVIALVRAIQSGKDDAAREAFEATLRIEFAARQK